MTLLIAIVIGGLIGWLAAAIMGRPEGILGSILIGIAGSFIGGLLSQLLTGSDLSSLTLNWGGVLWSLVGAIVLVAILNAFTGYRASHSV